MAKVVDPDALAIAINATATTEEVEIQTGAKTIELRVAGDLDDTAPGRDSGVTGRCLYSFLKEEWLASGVLRRFRFPIQMIYEGSFIVTNGWTFLADQSRDLVRDAGFNEVAASNIYACLISLGNMDASGSDLAYYIQTQSFTATTTDFDKTGELNENAVITGLTTYFKAFLREQGKTYGEYDLLTELGISAITFQSYFFPLTNGPDGKVTNNDTNVSTLTPYTNMAVDYLQGVGFTTWAISQVYPAFQVVQDQFGRWFITIAGGTSAVDDSDLAGGSDTGVTWVAYHGEELIGSTYYAFNRVITCASGTDTEVHEFLQWSLRQTGNINDDGATTAIPASQGAYGTVNGEVARLLSTYEGDTLIAEPGVVLRGFDANSTNNINHQPIDVDTGGLDADSVPLSSTRVAFPFVSAGNFVFSQNFVDATDSNTIYTAYFAYITQDVSTGVATTGFTGSQATIDYTADAGLLDHYSSGDYFTLDGFTDTNLNGLWIADGNPTTNTILATKQDGVTVSNEAAGNSITAELNPFESPGAVVVDDNGGTDLEGQISAATIAWDFDYTNNVQGGRTANTPAPCVLHAVSTTDAQILPVEFTITAATGINVAVNSSDELNYVNP